MVHDFVSRCIEKKEDKEVYSEKEDGGTVFFIHCYVIKYQ